MSSHCLVRISSAERLPGSVSSSDFRVSFQNVSELARVTSVVVKQVTVPNVEYNVPVPIVAKFGIGNASETVSIPIPAGQYTMTQLLAVIAAYSVNGYYITGVQNPTTLIVSFQLGGGSFSLGLVSLADGNTAAPYLGITATTPRNEGYTACQGLPNLSGPRNFYIASNVLGEGNNLLSPTFPRVGVFACIPLFVPFPGIEHYVCQHEELDRIDYPSQGQGKSLQTIDVRLYDANARIVDLKGLDWSFVLKVYHN